MLSDYVQLKNALSIPDSDLTQNAQLQQAVVAADAAVKQYCKRQSLETSVLVEYPLLRNGAEALVLNETPVRCYTLTGNITNGAATITGLSSTSNLVVGMPVLQAISQNNPVTTQPFPNGVTILSVDSSSQVTLTGNCTAASQSGLPFVFGLAMWIDFEGSYGDGIGSSSDGPFGTATLRYLGRDYSLQRDQPDGTSKSGKLTCLIGFWGLSSIAGSGWGWGWAGGGYGWSANGNIPLSVGLKPQYPTFPPGSVKVVYCAGLGVGATAPDGQLPTNTTIPADLTAATNMLAAWIYNNTDSGGIQYQSESYQGYNESVAQAVDWLKTEGDLGHARRLLSRYRRFVC